jgi:hypothetical protein
MELFVNHKDVVEVLGKGTSLIIHRLATEMAIQITPQNKTTKSMINRLRFLFGI